MKLLTSILAIASLFISLSALAGEPEIYEHRSKDAARGVDVVAYFSLEDGAKPIKGSKDITYEWKGATWRFATVENRKKFSDNPEAYAPQYGGYCAFAVAHGFTTSPRPENWKVVDGKLYLNNNRKSFQKWVADHKNKIAKADENWPDVLDN